MTIRSLAAGRLDKRRNITASASELSCVLGRGGKGRRTEDDAAELFPAALLEQDERARVVRVHPEGPDLHERAVERRAALIVNRSASATRREGRKSAANPDKVERMRTADPRPQTAHVNVRNDGRAATK